MSQLFTPLSLRSVTVPNRIVMSPMCMYTCRDGIPGDWHKIHLGSRAAGGVGMVVLEATAVSPVARITPGDLGLWSDEHVRALEPIAALISAAGSVPAIQLAHAGRKGGRTIPWDGNAPIAEEQWGKLPAPSALPFQPDWNTPEEMDEAAIARMVEDFAAATRRACRAGFRAIEAHFAHGYLLHEFFSPLANKRTDRFGGSFEGRAAVPIMVVRAMRAAMPDELPLMVRLSIVDWTEGGITLEDTIRLASMMKDEGVDLVDCSSGAVVPGEQAPVEPGYHAPMTREIRARTGLATGVVGLITEPEMAERFISDGAADLVFLARALLRDPYWPRMAAHVLGAENAIEIPIQYRRAVARMGGRTQW
ncbi:NADH:flavin oxidoreductase/NADH oxidase [Mesorhizobium sp. KR9-304]|uniref:NADH:flavin oxidoreductase/NADH oxidase n=1 Tax=Mesorhizobium sp. KR9-304 TaxID=3156614 RepID=UPI0032B59B65